MICQRCGNEIDVRRVNPDRTLTCPYCGLVYVPAQPAPQAPQQPNVQQGYGGRQDYGNQQPNVRQGYGSQQGYNNQQNYGNQPSRRSAQPARVQNTSALKKRIGGKVPLWGIIAAAVLLIMLAVALILLLGGKPAGNRGDLPASTFSASSAPRAGSEEEKTVTFGHYEQDAIPSNGPEAIEWIVLDKQDGKALLLSKYGLDTVPYNKEYEEVTWETCTLRAWLNNDFLNQAFSANEQKAILTTNVDNSANQGYFKWTTIGGNNTQDKIFLLSFAEANRYLNVSINNDHYKASVAPTSYAVAMGAFTNDGWHVENEKETGEWWLRSPGGSQNSAAQVSSTSVLKYALVHMDNCVIRPALWVDLNAGNF